MSMRVSEAEELWSFLNLMHDIRAWTNINYVNISLRQ